MNPHELLHLARLGLQCPDLLQQHVPAHRAAFEVIQAFHQPLEFPPPDRPLLVATIFATGQHVNFPFLLDELHLQRFMDLAPGPIYQGLLHLAQPALGRSDQIMDSLGPHLPQNFLRGNAPIHHPDPIRLAVQRFDASQKALQRRLIRGVSGHDLVGQRQPIRRDHQRDHHLPAVRPTIPAVTVLGLRDLFAQTLEVGARQVIEENVELRVEQRPPLLHQVPVQCILVFDQPIQAAVQPIFAGRREVHAQQFIQGRLQEPLPMNPPFAARSDQPIDRQDRHHLFPGHITPLPRQTLGPELVESQFPPQRQPQPAIPERPRPAKTQLAHPQTQGIHRIRRNLPVLGEQRHLAGFLTLLVEDFQRLSPDRLLRVIDLAQIQHLPLNHAVPQ